jgi:hypothetical protein
LLFDVEFFSAIMQGMPEANCMGETALHLYSCRGDIAAVQKLLPMCDDDYIMQRSKFRQTVHSFAVCRALCIKLRH